MKGFIWKILLFANLCLFSEIQAEERIILNGSWKFINQNGSISGMGTVPGSIYTDLMKANVLKDPLYRFNDLAYRWVAKDNWTYTSTFQASSDFLGKESVELWTEGIDTVSVISINDQVIGKTNNMFRRYIFNVKSALKAGNNNISVAFESAISYSADQANNYPYRVPEVCNKDTHMECNYNFIRKEATSFGWDWGPAFPTQGIWKEIGLVSYNTVTIEHLTTETLRSAATIIDWVLNVTVFFKFSGSGSKSGKLQLQIPELDIKNEKSITASPDNPTYTTNIYLMQTNHVKPWWPNGQGDQNLYNVSVTWTSVDGKEHCSRSVSVGFRTVELVQNEIQNGRTFFFRINDRPVFIRGSNWIPADNFQERITEDYLYRLLYSAKIANINMLIINGIGIYESEAFYALADKLGIMIWQDFMFVCALYPTNADFLQNVRMEATHQIRRLKSHPSVVIWSANNENEVALRTDWFGVKDHYELYYKDYVKLYIDTLRVVVNQEDTTRPFVPSCPSNGVESEKEGWVAKNPQDSHYGDVHHYDYTSDNWNWKVFPITRFLSEFGFQSWASFESVQKVSVPSDWVWNGTFAEWRQHHPDGNVEMYAEAATHIKMPDTTDKAKFFQNFIYITQMNQAVAVKTETELCLRRQSFLDSDGNGYNMGSLYWQLNDVWQAPTWASIEYGGKWKMLHYYVKNLYNRTILSAEVDGDSFRIYSIDHSLPPFEGANLMPEHKGDARNSSTYVLEIKAYSWSNLKPQKIWNIPISEMPTKASTIIYIGSMSDMLSQAQCDASSCFFYFTLFYDSNMRIAGPSNWQLNSYFKQSKGLQMAKLVVSNIEQVSPRQLSFTLSTDNIAVFVWMEASGLDGYFSDNSFIMVNQQMKLYFNSWSDGVSTNDFKNSIKVMSLMDIYK